MIYDLKESIGSDLSIGCSYPNCYREAVAVIATDGTYRPYCREHAEERAAETEIGVER